MDSFNCETQRQILHAISFFTNPKDDRAEYISAINSLAPTKAYVPHKKRSRIFRALCDSLGVTDNSAGSNFQKLFDCGCAGYARDDVTFMVFTVADPSDSETLNNRKTSRQLFMYKPYNGLLLQSRLYNTNCGTCGAQEDSKLYRDLIQREISELERVPNLWKPFPYVTNKMDCHICCGTGFGGYANCTYRDLDSKISLRADQEYNL